MKRKMILFGCCIAALLTTIFTSCKQEVLLPEMVTISYVSEFGTLSNTEKIVEKGYKLKTEDLAPLTEDGYKFVKWDINKEEAKVGTEINKDSVLVAKWNKVLDNNAPKDVTFGEITAADGKAVVNWTIPKDMDSDLKGFELSMKPACGTLVNPVILGSTVKSFSVDGLKNGTPYTFTIKSFDTSNIFSTGVSKEATPKDTKDYDAPAEVTSYTATNLDGTVALKWTDPTDKDLFGIEITYTPKGKNYRSMEKMVEGSIFVSPKTQYVEIPKLTNDTEYTFTLKTMDLSGNKSSGVSVKCTPKIIEGKPLSITLTPSTIEKTNKDITVSVNVQNTRKVKAIKYAEGTQVVSYFAQKGTDIIDNSFTVTKNGTYTVFVQDVDGKREVKTIDITNIDKTGPAALNNFSAKYSVADKKITLTWEEPNDSDYTKVTITGEGSNSYVINKGTKICEIPNIESDSNKTYTFKAVTEDDIGNKGTEAFVDILAWNPPIFTSFDIPKASPSKVNDQVIATVKGSNFTAQGITAKSFTLSCETSSSITTNAQIEVIDDAKLRIKLTIPNEAKEYKVSISYKDSKQEGNFIVQDFSSGFEAGKILLSDDTIVDSESYISLTSNTPVAIFCGFNNYGVPLLVGLKESEKSYRWTKQYTPSFEIYSEEISCSPSKNGGPFEHPSKATFTGDLNGSDNWEIICKLDPNGTKDAANIYPAYNWINNYGNTYNLPEYYKDGWYMPTIAEMCEIYKNKEAIDNAIQKLGSNANKLPMLSRPYWTSSFHDTYKDRVMTLSYDPDGSISSDPKYTRQHAVRSIRAF